MRHRQCIRKRSDSGIVALVNQQLVRMDYVHTWKPSPASVLLFFALELVFRISHTSLSRRVFSTWLRDHFLAWVFPVYLVISDKPFPHFFLFAGCWKIQATRQKLYC